MKAMKLPPPIQTYFEADQHNDGEALVSAFATDAVVADEGRSHAGREAIGAWWRDVKAKYQHVAQALELSEADGAVRVCARVTGQFPGSPADLTFAFRLADGRIARLEIGA